MAGLYVHIPFCHSKCAYCDFFSTPRRGMMEEYVGAVSGEWHSRKDELTEPVETVYIGGGTPSVLPLPLLASLVETLPVPSGEYTIEANPEDVSPAWAQWVADSPIGRVSMGVQSFDDSQLRSVGRRHTAAQAVAAIENLRCAGISELSCDLIYGLPGQTLDSWRRQLDTLLSLRPPHLSCYLLSYEEGTRLWAMRSAGKVKEASEELALDMYACLTEATRAAGYSHYEISNFCLEDHRAIHNSNYWLDRPYLGLGVSAHSFSGTRRSYNPANIKEYISRGGKGLAIVEEETPDQRLNDFIITALRTSRGLHLSEAGARFGSAAADHIISCAAPHIASGNMRLDNGVLTIPESNWLLSDRFMTDLMKVD